MGAAQNAYPISSLAPPSTITGINAATVPLTITGASGQSADLVDVGTFGGAAGNAFKVDQFLNIIVGGGIIATANVRSNAGIFEVQAGAVNAHLRGGSAGVQVSLEADATHLILLGQGVANAVNYVQITNAITGNAPIIAATGTDAAVSLNYNTKGGGNHNFNSNILVPSGSGVGSSVDGLPGIKVATGAIVGLNGNAPVAKAAAITAPATQTAGYVQADVQSIVTAVNAIRTALTNIGITS